MKVALFALLLLCLVPVLSFGKARDGKYCLRIPRNDERRFNNDFCLSRSWGIALAV